MLTMLKDWTGTVEIDGIEYNSVSEAFTTVNKPLEGNVHIILKPMNMKVENKPNNPVQKEAVESPVNYKITVKQYMTKKASPEFDFMEKWNNNNPMPLRTMIGTIDKETRGMVHMKLHGDIYAEKICNCMKCGRTITNVVSQYFGMGPECGGHGYVNPFDTQEELKAAVNSYRKELQNMTWEGWVIKSAIIEQEELSNE